MANYVTYIDRKPYLARLPFGGAKKSGRTEWNHFMELADIGSPFQTQETAVWCQETPRPGKKTKTARLTNNLSETRIVRGGQGVANRWRCCPADKRSTWLGYQPVLVPLRPGIYLPDHHPWPEELIGTTIKLGTLCVNRSPLDISDNTCCQCLPGDKLSLTDTHPNPRKQIRFIRAGSVLIADHVLAVNVSWLDLQACNLIPELDPPDIFQKPVPGSRIFPTSAGCLVMTPNKSADPDLIQTRFVHNTGAVQNMTDIQFKNGKPVSVTLM